MNVNKNIHEASISVVIISVVSLFVAGFYRPPDLLAQMNNNNGIIDMNQPLYSEHYKLIGKKEVTINGTKVTQETVSGNGSARGINVTSTGHASIFPRPGDVVYIKGKDDFTATPSSGKATYTFEAIGNYGVALFKPNATGSLSFLSNTVAVYKVDKNSNGTNTFTMWKWGR